MSDRTHWRCDCGLIRWTGDHHECLQPRTDRRSGNEREDAMATIASGVEIASRQREQIYGLLRDLKEARGLAERYRRKYLSSFSASECSIFPWEKDDPEAYDRLGIERPKAFSPEEAAMDADHLPEGDDDTLDAAGEMKRRMDHLVTEVLAASDASDLDWRMTDLIAGGVGGPLEEFILSLDFRELLYGDLVSDAVQRVIYASLVSYISLLALVSGRPMLGWLRSELRRRQTEGHREQLRVLIATGVPKSDLLVSPEPLDLDASEYDSVAKRQAIRSYLLASRSAAFSPEAIRRAEKEIFEKDQANGGADEPSCVTGLPDGETARSFLDKSQLSERDLEVLRCAVPRSLLITVHGGDAWAMHRALGNVRIARRLLSMGLLAEDGRTTTVDGLRILSGDLPSTVDDSVENSEDQDGQLVAEYKAHFLELLTQGVEWKSLARSKRLSRLWSLISEEEKRQVNQWILRALEGRRPT